MNDTDMLSFHELVERMRRLEIEFQQYGSKCLIASIRELYNEIKKRLSVAIQASPEAEKDQKTLKLLLPKVEQILQV